MKTSVFEKPEEYIRDYEEFKKGKTHCLLRFNKDKSKIEKCYPRNQKLYEIEKESLLYWGNYVGEIDLVHKFRFINI